MNGFYPARRLMDLFAAYEALPRHRELVDLTVLPLVRAEITAYLCNVQNQYLHGHFRFIEAANRQWDEAQHQRRFSVVQSCEVRFMSEDRCISVNFQLMHEAHIRGFDIPFTRISEHEYTTALDSAERQLDRQINALKALQ